MSLKENIKKYRLQNNLTLDNVAKSIGVTPQTIQKYEKGTIITIPQDKIEKLAKLFNISPSKLVGWDNVEKNIKRLDQSIDELTNSIITDKNEMKEFKKFQASYMEYMNSLTNEEYTQRLTNNEFIKEKDLLSKFNQLNEKGQDKAIENVDLLTKVPEFKK